MTTVDDIRIPYQPELYVAREDAESEVQKWLAGNGRLLTITSPPATGKSWLLKWIEIQITNTPSSHSYWLDARSFLTSDTISSIGTHPIDYQKQSEWLRQFFKTAKEKCPPVSEYDSSIELSVAFEKFAQTVQTHCPNQKFYLFVEGGDEPTPNAWRLIERQILEPVAHSNKWRFIIVLRQEQRLYSYLLRSGEKRLVLGSFSGTLSQTQISEYGREQLTKLITVNSNSNLPPLEEILTVLPGYNWSHAGLNSFLFFQVKTNCHLAQSQWLQSDYLVRGIKEISLLSTDEVHQIIPWLTEIAVTQDKNWSFEDLLGVTGQATLVAWSQRIDKLQTYGFTQNVSGTRFQIIDGVREFFQAASAFNETIFDKVSIKVDVELEQTPASTTQSQVIIKQLANSMQADPDEIREFEREKYWITLEVPVGLIDSLQGYVRQNQNPLDSIQIITILPKNLDTLIRTHFDVDELQSLVYHLNIEYQDLPGETKHTKILALIDYCKRHNRLDALINACSFIHPHVKWQ